VVPLRITLLKGEKFDVTAYCTATNSLRRLLGDIGQERGMRDVSLRLTRI
jgi:hypothetical protein